MAVSICYEAQHVLEKFELGPEKSELGPAGAHFIPILACQFGLSILTILTWGGRMVKSGVLRQGARSANAAANRAAAAGDSSRGDAENAQKMRCNHGFRG
jgi:hypothetical protein